MNFVTINARVGTTPRLNCQTLNVVTKYIRSCFGKVLFDDNYRGTEKRMRRDHTNLSASKSEDRRSAAEKLRLFIDDFKFGVIIGGS